MTLWGLWIARNHRVFSTHDVVALSTPTIISEGLRQHSLFTVKKDWNLRSLHPPEWVNDYPPSFYCIVLQDSGSGNLLGPTVILVDGSWNSRTNRSGMVWCPEVRQYGEKGCLEWASCGLPQLALHAEMNACLAGLQWAIVRSISEITIYMDSTEVVRCLRDAQDSDVSVR